MKLKLIDKFCIVFFVLTGAEVMYKGLAYIVSSDLKDNLVKLVESNGSKQD